MDEKVFIYLRLRLGDRALSRSKIREFAGLGSLLVQFLRRTLSDGLDLPEEEPWDGVPVLDYVDGNTDEVLISFHVDPTHKVQVIEGCIPPRYQHRMLDPNATAFSLSNLEQWGAEALSEERRAKLSEQLARSQTNLLERIRDQIDPEGHFVVRVPLGSE